ncbi:MAG: hypothetical protein KIT09_07245 [Bryobacteraceae bacterium]|nr:hypothetical protein [Bryobacteraceae bacterium]
MNALDRLNAYLGQLERRLRLKELTRGAALFGLSALALTVLLVLVANRFAFSTGSVTGARVVLYLALAAVLALGLVVPILRLNRIRAARRAEEVFPEFEQRLLTVAERRDDAAAEPFLELLAGDAMEVARNAEPGQVVARGWIVGFVSAAVAAVGMLIWLAAAGPGFLGYGASLLWAGAPRGKLEPFYDIRVTPGDRKVRRGSDQVVSASLMGFQSDAVSLFARYDGTSKWEEVRMKPQLSGPGYEFLFAGLPESVEYYVKSGAVRTKSYTLTVVDLPSVKRIRVTYKFPGWTRLAAEVVENGGDLRAVEGTEAQLSVETDKPLGSGLLALDDGTEIPLTDAPGNRSAGVLRIEKDGLYHVAMRYEGDLVRLTDDYFIEARLESPPTLQVRRPGRDYKANPVEEVTVEVQAEDDFGLQEVNLLYSVNGGPEQKVDLLKQKGATQTSNSAVIFLEDHKLRPGDIVSFHAVARDARASTRSDMFFIEAQPFEREYSQSQQSGGGGGGGEDQNQISARQKEIIAATWNILRDQSRNRAEVAEQGKFLSEVQSTLRGQALSLAKRMRARELSTTNEEFSGFSNDMEAAAQAMGDAANQLKGLQWKEAIVPEQKALQHLLRAESMFRKIQVARGNQGGGGGGGMGRDLENLFDLELDTEKNQYETGQNAPSGDQRSREMDEALQKLKELARRQQELAQQRPQQQTPQQRWQQELLRREAERLQRRMEELSRSSQQQGSPQRGMQSSMGGRSQGDPHLRQALERLRQATEDMRKATSQNNSDSPQGEAEARRAAERLQEASDMMNRLRRQESSEQLDDLSRRAEALAQQQQQFAEKLRQAYAGHRALGGQGKEGAEPRLDPKAMARLSEEKKQMSDELQRLEREMQDAVKDLAGSQRAASSKLREALGEMQQKELGLRMKFSAEWIRRGLGPYAWLREAPVTEGLNRLSEQLKDAQRSLGESPKGQESLESALARVEQLRNQMQQLAQSLRQGEQQGRGQQQGEQQGRGQQQGAQQGRGDQQGGQQPGQGAQQGQPGGQQGQSGQQGGGQAGEAMGSETLGGGSGPLRSFSAMNTGERQFTDTGVRPPATDIPAIEQTYREGLSDLSQLRRSMTDNPEITADIQELIRQMQRLDPKRFPGNPRLLDQLQTQLLPNLEQIELRLRRQLDDKGDGQVRSGLSRPVPPGYADAVAEYFRKLSKSR